MAFISWEGRNKERMENPPEMKCDGKIMNGARKSLLFGENVDSLGHTRGILEDFASEEGYC